jgi:hypothetical protein
MTRSLGGVKGVLVDLMVAVTRPDPRQALCSFWPAFLGLDLSRPSGRLVGGGLVGGEVALGVGVFRRWVRRFWTVPDLVDTVHN